MSTNPLERASDRHGYRTRSRFNAKLGSFNGPAPLLQMNREQD